MFRSQHQIPPAAAAAFSLTTPPEGGAERHIELLLYVKYRHMRSTFDDAALSGPARGLVGRDPCFALLALLALLCFTSRRLILCWRFPGAG